MGRTPLPAALLRAGFRALTAPRALRFAAALRNPAAAQAATLERIVRLVAGSPYARHLRLPVDGGYARFAAAVPVVDYDDLAPWVENQVASGVPQLSVEPPVAYERTSGSSGRAKLVPYTPSLLASFGACFVIWAHDLVAHGPRFSTARMFFSTSPAFQEGERTPAGVPVSLVDDAAYLPARYQRLFDRSFVVPPALKFIRDETAYRRALAATLLAAERLEIISVWSPTYLLAILDTIVQRQDEITVDFRRARTGPPEAAIPLPPVRTDRLALLGCDPIPWERVWPELKLLSCWTDAASAGFLPDLRAAFPAVTIQGKGLLATEAPVTLPLVRAPAPVPLLDEVFLEFEAPDGCVRRLHELEDGHEYEVIVSQSGGLLRYRMHDRVRAEGCVGHTPCLRFLGRGDRVSDLAGEKLGEPFVRSVLAAVFGGGRHCSFLVPERPERGPCRYRCVTDHCAARDQPQPIACRLDAALQAAVHYRQARRLGQLAPLAIDYRPDARSTWDAIHIARGIRWGAIKFESLVTALPGMRECAVPAESPAHAAR